MWYAIDNLYNTLYYVVLFLFIYVNSLKFQKRPETYIIIIIIIIALCITCLHAIRLSEQQLISK